MYKSERRVREALQKDPVRELRGLASLGDGLGTYGRVRVAITGDDLTLGPTGFQIKPQAGASGAAAAAATIVD